MVALHHLAIAFAVAFAAATLQVNASVLKCNNWVEINSATTANGVIDSVANELPWVGAKIDDHSQWTNEEAIFTGSTTWGAAFWSGTFYSLDPIPANLHIKFRDSGGNEIAAIRDEPGYAGNIITPLYAQNPLKLTGSETAINWAATGDDNDGSWRSLTRSITIESCAEADVAVCGDGKVDVGEACDDANYNSQDGCYLCAVEPEFTCSGGSLTSASTCVRIDGCVLINQATTSGLNDAGDGSYTLMIGCLAAPAVCEKWSYPDAPWNDFSVTFEQQHAMCRAQDCFNDNCYTDCSATSTKYDVGLSVRMQQSWASSTIGTINQDHINTANQQLRLAGGGLFVKDGNTIQWESGYGPSDVAYFKIYTCPVIVAVCGDGKLEGSEVCDDGNTVADDGCAADCTGVDPGYTCTGGSPTSQDTCGTTCGDGKRAGAEVCDDSNAAAGDGCAADCTGVDPGYTCTGGSPTSQDTCGTTCGDSKRAGAEVCDDGNVATGDGCAADCTAVEPGYTCTGGTPTTLDTCFSACGDSKREGDEACDDANTNNGDGCSSLCSIEAGFVCTGGSAISTDVCTGTPTCTPAIEMPIPGMLTYGPNYFIAFSASNWLDATQASSNSPFTHTANGWTKVSDVQSCLQNSNNCYGSAEDAIYTNAKVTIFHNGVQIATNIFYTSSIAVTGSPLDISQLEGESWASMVDKTSNSFYATGSLSVQIGELCSAPGCGNGNIDGSEECDDGNEVALDGCYECRREWGWTCETGDAPDCNLVYTQVGGSTCQNGVVEPGEQCDSGFTNDPFCKYDGGSETSQVTANGIDVKCGEQWGSYYSYYADTNGNRCDSVGGSNAFCESGTHNCIIQVSLPDCQLDPTANAKCAYVYAPQLSLSEGGNANQLQMSAYPDDLQQWSVCMSWDPSPAYSITHAKAKSADLFDFTPDPVAGFFDTTTYGSEVESYYMRSGALLAALSSCDRNVIFLGNWNHGTDEGWGWKRTGCNYPTYPFQVDVVTVTNETQAYFAYNAWTGFSADPYANVVPLEGSINCRSFMDCQAWFGAGWICQKLLIGNYPPHGDAYSQTCIVGSAPEPDLCGNALRTGVEACDDGNTAGGDGCAADCTGVETGYSCSGGNPSTIDVCIVICGDGKRIGVEVCDDGNGGAGDGCSTTCTAEPGFTCTGGTPTTADVCIINCGNGKREGDEACDDSNAAAGDGCSTTCTIESGYTCAGGTLTSEDTCIDVDECTTNSHNCNANAECTNTVGSFTCACNSGYSGNGVNCNDVDECSLNTDNCHAYADCTNTVGSFTCACFGDYTGDGVLCIKCGDGVRAGSEACDDGNTAAGDGCSTTCTIEAGAWDLEYVCPDEGGSLCELTCGDGQKSNYKTCDIGTYTGGINSDACKNCKLQTDYTCYGNPTSEIPDGFGFASGGSIQCYHCNDATTCSSNGQCTSKLKSCRCAHAGPNHKWANHDCGANVSLSGTREFTIDVATASQTLELVGDTKFSFELPQGLKKSDGSAVPPLMMSSMLTSDFFEGRTSLNYGITNTGAIVKGLIYNIGTEVGEVLTFDNSVEITADCSVVNPIRVCRIAYLNLVEDTPDWLPYTRDGNFITASVTHFSDFVVVEDFATCGDSKREVGEMCDDGNTASGDGCAADCSVVEIGYTCSGGSSGGPDTCAEVDECADNLDNCHAQATCSNTAGSFTCTCGAGLAGDGVTCGLCGNGNVDPDEYCDDSNLADDDGCDSTCKPTANWYCIGSPSSCQQGTSHFFKIIDHSWIIPDYTGAYASKGRWGNSADTIAAWTHFRIHYLQSYNGILPDEIMLLQNAENSYRVYRKDLDGTFPVSQSYWCVGTGCVITPQAYKADLETAGKTVWVILKKTESHTPIIAATNFVDSADEWTKDTYDMFETTTEAQAALNLVDPFENLDTQLFSGTDKKYYLAFYLANDPQQLRFINYNGAVSTDIPVDMGAYSVLPPYVICGDGHLEGKEGCDDLNVQAGDGCSTTCSIEPGYVCPGGNETHRSTCSDIDECATSGHNCATTGSTCTNAVGSFTCACDSGWTGDGLTCTDDDECANSEDNNCDARANSHCSNTVGAYECPCDAGYLLSGSVCNDVDECANSGTNNCHTDATCSNTAGSFTCTCNEGYGGNGVDCTWLSVCGNGDKEFGEACDDGNVVGGDGCSADCAAIESGYSCTNPGSACNAGCGDGTVTSPETCDIGLNPTDGCLHCVLQPNYKCSSTACYFCNADDTCSGNGVCNPTFTACRCLHTQNARWVGPSCAVSKALLGNGKKNVENIDVSGGSLPLRLDGVLSPLFAATLPQNLKLQGGADVPSVMMSAITPNDFLTQRTVLQQSLTTQGLEIKGNVYNIEAQNGNELFFDAPVSIEISCADVAVHKVCAPIYLDTDSAVAVVLPYSRVGDFITASVNHFSDYGAGEGDPVCGDSKLEVGEVCDDGNTNNGDGCAADCSAVEAGYTCSGGSPTSADICITICGDGLRAGVEVCDDSNTASGDGCSTTCTTEPGFTCAGGSPTAADICITICGDGLRAGVEVCDDSNTASGDGCSGGCTTEPGYTCAGGTPTSADSCGTTCGDGKRAGAEGCDDGNSASSDGCSTTCTTEPGFTCTGGTPTAADTCGTACGDGKRAGVEACDDGNSVSSDGCSATCTTEVGYSCSGGNPSTIDVCIVICGDGKRVGIEVCDDGNEVALDGCSATCTTEIGYTCTGGSLTDADTCTATQCGDGKWAEGSAEECENAVGVPTNGCNQQCEVNENYYCMRASGQTFSACLLTGMSRYNYVYM